MNNRLDRLMLLRHRKVSPAHHRGHRRFPHHVMTCNKQLNLRTYYQCSGFIKHFDGKFQSSIQEDERRIYQDTGAVSHDETTQGISQGKIGLLPIYGLSIIFPSSSPISLNLIWSVLFHEKNNNKQISSVKAMNALIL